MGTTFSCFHGGNKKRRALGRDPSVFQKAATARKRRKIMGQTSAKHKLPQGQVRKLQRQVSFSENEIKDWYHEFCHSTSRRHDDHDLFLTEEEFAKVYNSVYRGQSDDFAKHVFRTFDLDGDGRVDFREFLIGLSFSGSTNFEKQLSWAFRVYDVNNSGYISREEMMQIFHSVFKMIGPVVVNGTTQDPGRMADDVFRQLDTDGDGRISWQEFHDGAYRHPTVLQLLQCGPADADETDHAHPSTPVQ